MPLFTIASPTVLTIAVILSTDPPVTDRGLALIVMFFLYSAILGATVDIMGAIKKGRS